MNLFFRRENRILNSFCVLYAAGYVFIFLSKLGCALGNFMFDQDFSWDTTHGLAIWVDFYSTKTHFVLVPLIIQNERSEVAAEAGLPAGRQVAEFDLP